jgi:membrane protein required for colicin V production
MLGPLTYLDAGLIALALVSGLLAMYRGFTREVLSITSWVLAGAATLYFVMFHKSFAEDIATQYGQNATLVQIGIGALIFVVTLIVVHLFTARFSDRVLDSRVGMIDRMLGFGFGVLRGFLLVVIAFLFFDFLVPTGKKDFIWIRNAKALPYVQRTGDMLSAALKSAIPKNLNLPGKAPEGEDQEKPGQQRG